MTFHVAIAEPRVGAVMVSDSQGSTQLSEIHGWQKQVVGNGFLVGFAGQGAPIEHLLEAIWARSTDATGIEELIARCVDEDLTEAARSQVQVLLVRDGKGGPVIRTYSPAVFRAFRDAGPSLATIGSGSDFANAANKRDTKLGISRSISSIADLVTLADSLADSANESITVNDQLLMGIMSGSQTYLLGNAAVRTTRVPRAIHERWTHVGATFGEVQALTSTIRSTSQDLQRTFSCTWSGGVPDSARVSELAFEMQGLKDELDTILQQYFAWYDSTIAAAS